MENNFPRSGLETSSDETFDLFRNFRHRFWETSWVWKWPENFSGWKLWGRNDRFRNWVWKHIARSRANDQISQREKNTGNSDPRNDWSFIQRKKSKDQKPTSKPRMGEYNVLIISYNFYMMTNWTSNAGFRPVTITLFQIKKLKKITFRKIFDEKF